MATSRRIIDHAVLPHIENALKTITSRFSSYSSRQLGTRSAVEISLLGSEKISTHVAQLIQKCAQENFGADTLVMFKNITASAPEELVYEEKSPKSKLIRLENVRRIIVIASGKGGVGKSTIASSLACALSEIGWNTGLLDADIYGASIPEIFDLEAGIELTEKNMMRPVMARGIAINSVGFVSEKDEAIIWRGPLISKALNKLLLKTEWAPSGSSKPLDYLVVDTPPGTGDIHLTLLENFAIDGYFLVTTPHRLSTSNALKTKDMFSKFSVPCLGTVLNMSQTQDLPSGFPEPIFAVPKIEGAQGLIFEQCEHLREMARLVGRVLA